MTDGDVFAAEVKALIERFDRLPGETSRAVARSLNQTARWLRRSAALETRKEVSARLAVISGRMRMRSATVRRWRVDLRAFLYEMPAILVDHSSTTRGFVVDGELVAGSFVGRGRGALAKRIFVRRGTGAYPLRQVKVPMTPLASALDEVGGRVYGFVLDSLERELRDVV